MMRTVYDQVGWVPQDKVNFDNTLKPLIDLDGELHWQSGVVTVSIMEVSSLNDLNYPANVSVHEKCRPGAGTKRCFV